jgi:hypothetical protein
VEIAGTVSQRGLVAGAIKTSNGTKLIKSLTGATLPDLRIF